MPKEKLAVCRHKRCFRQEGEWKRYSCSHNNIYQHLRLDHTYFCPNSCLECKRKNRDGIASELTTEENISFIALQQRSFQIDKHTIEIIDVLKSLLEQ